MTNQITTATSENNSNAGTETQNNLVEAIIDTPAKNTLKKKKFGDLVVVMGMEVREGTKLYFKRMKEKERIDKAFKALWG